MFNIIIQYTCARSTTLARSLTHHIKNPSAATSLGGIPPESAVSRSSLRVVQTVRLPKRGGPSSALRSLRLPLLLLCLVRAGTTPIRRLRLRLLRRVYRLECQSARGRNAVDCGQRRLCRWDMCGDGLLTMEF